MLIAAAIFAFDAGRLYALSDASDVANLDALNALVAILDLLAAELIEPRWYVPYDDDEKVSLAATYLRGAD